MQRRHRIHAWFLSNADITPEEVGGFVFSLLPEIAIDSVLISLATNYYNWAANTELIQ